MLATPKTTPRRRLVDRSLVRYQQLLILLSFGGVSFLLSEVIHAHSTAEVRQLLSGFAAVLIGATAAGATVFGAIFKNQQAVAQSRAELLETQEKRNEQLQEQINENAASIEEMGKKNKLDLDAANAKHEKDIAQMRADHDADIEQMKSKHENEITELRGQIDILREEKEERTRWNERLQHDNDELRRIHSECEAERQANIARLEELRQEHAGVLDELTAAKMREEQLEAEVSALREEVQTLRAEIAFMSERRELAE